jgi:hypothetical protein
VFIRWRSVEQYPKHGVKRKGLLVTVLILITLHGIYFMPRFNPPERFNFSNPTEWLDWKERFLRFRMASKLNIDDDEVQISALTSTMGKGSGAYL